MGLKLAMVDDDEPSRIQLKWQMHQWSLAQSETYQMQPFTDGKAFLYEIEDGTVFDIVFIAERLNGEQMGGLTLAKRMREMAYKGALVILADTRQGAVGGYEVEAAGCLMKPFDMMGVSRVMHTVYRRLSSTRVLFRIGGENRYIPAANIVFVESNNNRCCIHCTGEEYEFYCKLDDIERQLSNQTFLRCHKSFLVNMNAVRCVSADGFEMNGGDTVPIRQRGRSAICAAYRAYCESQSQLRLMM